jgi:hypothetical protein
MESSVDHSALNAVPPRQTSTRPLGKHKFTTLHLQLIFTTKAEYLYSFKQHLAAFGLFLVFLLRPLFKYVLSKRQIFTVSLRQSDKTASEENLEKIICIPASSKFSPHCVFHTVQHFLF